MTRFNYDPVNDPEDVDKPSNCAEGLPEGIQLDYDLPCNICEQVDSCFYDLFTIDGAEEEKEQHDIVNRVPADIVRSYLNHLYETKKHYEHSMFQSRNSDGILVKDVIAKRINILEKIIGASKAESGTQ